MVGCGATAGDGSGKPAPHPRKPAGPEAAEAAEAAEADRPASCPKQADAPKPLPGVQAKHRTLEYWLERGQEQFGDLDEPLIPQRRIEDHNRAMRQPHDDGRPLGEVDLLAPVDEALLLEEVNDRLAYMHEHVASGEYLDADGQKLDESARTAFETVDTLPDLEPQLRIALEPLALRCGPRKAGLFTEPVDPEFNRNNCSTIRAQEVVQVLADWPGGMQLVRTRYAMGWIDAELPLSSPIAESHRDRAVRGPKLELTRTVQLEPASGASGPGRKVDARTLVPQAPDSERRVLYGTADGLVRSAPLEQADFVSTERPITRRAVLKEAFELLGTPYGWGGHKGGRDCSRFLLDVFARFGLHLPRHSGRQALAGTFRIGVEDLGEKRKELLIDSAAQKGLVLMHFPGHIMLHLGKNDEGRRMAIHSFAEYVTPCEGTEASDGGVLETLHRVDEVTVSDLELGRGSSRTSFIERVTDIIVLGDPPGVELEGVAQTRPAAPIEWQQKPRCDDSVEVAVFQSPSVPHHGRPVRVIVTSGRDARPARLTLIDPEGKRRTPEVHRLGGPPWTWWAEVEGPEPGRWTALLGDGERVAACERFRVRHRAPPPPDKLAEDAPVWEAKWKWEEDTENLYSAFIEQLYSKPVDKDITWDKLQQLLSDPDRNLLYNHLSLGEDDKLRLEPDCADLPYFLRGYFAWKTRLPFAFRRCTRGGPGVPPACGEELHTNMRSVDEDTPLEAFRRFIRLIKSGVHSGSARTAPDANRTDLYPVALNRDALRPGTVFADPHGHLLVVADWRPQTMDSYGVLVGADAQPDGTVGRRRFWKGSFLFSPDTSNAGAGFKRWRPVVYASQIDPRRAVGPLDPEAGRTGGDRKGADSAESGQDGKQKKLAQLNNQALRETETHVPYSEQQYEGTEQDFYDRMAKLINPRPLEPVAKQRALVDALEEAVARRVNSVNNAVEFMEKRDWAPIEMPTGYDIFETSGAWENYSTPARDMRLLISIDAVAEFPDAVARNPEQYGLEPGDEVDETVSKLRDKLQEMLEGRTFEYTRSDGSKWQLTLKDVVDRAKTFEMSYHPNDCVEIRWAAPKGSKERAPCDQHAPDAHRKRMRKYRDWFRERERPPRGT